MTTESLAELVRFAPDAYGFRWQRVYYHDLSDAIATARAAGLADDSPEMTTLVGSILHPKYETWRRFDELLALNIQGMIAWRAGTSPSAH
jgi:hypothetical protein